MNWASWLKRNTDTLHLSSAWLKFQPWNRLARLRFFCHCDQSPQTDSKREVPETSPWPLPSPCFPLDSSLTNLPSDTVIGWATSSLVKWTMNRKINNTVYMCTVVLLPMAWVAIGHASGWRIAGDLPLWHVCLCTRRPWTNSPTPKCYMWLALIRAEGVNGTWVMCP